MSLKKDILDYDAYKILSWPFYTSTKQFADYTALDQLPKVKLMFDYQFNKDEKFGKISLKVKNPSASIAFFMFMDVLNASTQLPILPIYWNDNYVTLLPGEERTYEASYFLSDSDGSRPLLEAKAWNVDKETIK